MPKRSRRKQQICCMDCGKIYKGELRTIQSLMVEHMSEGHPPPTMDEFIDNAIKEALTLRELCLL